MSTRVSSFGIEVSDLARSAAFYTDALGLSVSFRIDNDTLEEVAVNDGEGGPAILLMRTKALPAPDAAPKTGKVVLITDDVHALHGAALSAGATSERDPAQYPGTSYTIGMVRDFDGNLVEMLQMG